MLRSTLSCSFCSSLRKGKKVGWLQPARPWMHCTGLNAEKMLTCLDYLYKLTVLHITYRRTYLHTFRLCWVAKTIIRSLASFPSSCSKNGSPLKVNKNSSVKLISSRVLGTHLGRFFPFRRRTLCFKSSSLGAVGRLAVDIFSRGCEINLFVGKLDWLSVSCRMLWTTRVTSCLRCIKCINLALHNIFIMVKIIHSTYSIAVISWSMCVPDSLKISPTTFKRALQPRLQSLHLHHELLW